jgi:hypothetical protein
MVNFNSYVKLPEGNQLQFSDQAAFLLHWNASFDWMFLLAGGKPANHFFISMCP